MQSSGSLGNNIYSSVDNKTYFDVPVCDKYSNISYSNTVPKVKTFSDLNQQISKRVNNGNNFYYVDSMPNIPSPSLYNENDNDYSPYYKKKEEEIVEQFSAEQGFAEQTLTACFIILFFALIIFSYYFMNSYFKNEQSNKDNK